jgi:hypothetical protein
VLFVLLFRYVFGGAIRTPGSSYIDYLMPGADKTIRRPDPPGFPQIRIVA